MAAKPTETQIHLRVDDDEAARLDRYAEFMKKTAGVDLTRAGAVLALARQALTVFEQRLVRK